MSADLIKRLRDALQQAADCLSLEVILQGRDPDLVEWNAAIAEADAHLSSVGQSRDEWAKEAEKLAINAHGPLAANAHWEDREEYEIKRKRNLFLAHLRAVPDAPPQQASAQPKEPTK